MPPTEGFTVAHFLTVANIERSAEFYEKVFGNRILSRGDSSGAPGYIQIANTWLIVNVGGGPTPDKPTVVLSVPPDPDAVSSFMNLRVADIHAAMNCGASAARRSSLSRRTSTGRRAAIFATLMATSSKSVRASRTSPTASCDL